MGWESNARGLSVGATQIVSVEKMAKKDFVIASSGLALHTNIQNAYEAGIPCFYTMNSDPKAKALQTGLDPDSWNAVKGESADLDQAIADLFVGGWSFTKMRVVHGILLDVHCYNKDRLVSGSWFVGYNNWLLEKLEDLTGLSNKDGYFRKYVYARYNLLEGSSALYSGNEKTTVQTFFYQYQKNISSLSLSEVDESGFPTAIKPTLPYNDSSMSPWKFWLYHANSDGTYDVLFNGTKQTLYGAIGYDTSSSNSNSSSDSDSSENQNPSTGDYSGLIAAIDRLTDAIVSTGGVG